MLMNLIERNMEGTTNEVGRLYLPHHQELTTCQSWQEEVSKEQWGK